MPWGICLFLGDLVPLLLLLLQVPPPPPPSLSPLETEEERSYPEAGLRICLLEKPGGGLLGEVKVVRGVYNSLTCLGFLCSICTHRCHMPETVKAECFLISDTHRPIVFASL